MSLFKLAGINLDKPHAVVHKGQFLSRTSHF